MGRQSRGRVCPRSKVRFALIALMPKRTSLGTAYYFLDRYRESIETIDRALAGNLGRNTQVTGRTVSAASYAQLNRQTDAERERNAVMRIAPFLNAERFPSQFGTQTRTTTCWRVLKAGFH